MSGAFPSLQRGLFMVRASMLIALFVFGLVVFAPDSDLSLFAQDGETPAETVDTSSSDPAEGPESSSLFTILSFLIPALGAVGLAFTFWKSKWVADQSAGSEKMERIAKNITDGAMSFLKAEYSVLFIFVIAVAALLGYAGQQQGALSSPYIAASFVLGAFCSAFAGFIGMRVATKANVRTTNAAQVSLSKALEVASVSYTHLTLPTTPYV